MLTGTLYHWQFLVGDFHGSYRLAYVGYRFSPLLLLIAIRI